MLQKQPINFVLMLMAANGIALGIHLLVLHQRALPLFNNMLPEAYIINFIMALGIGLALYALRNKYTQSLGFLFLAGTAFKFVVFFLVFNPYYKLDNVVSRIEFVTFFIPYGVNLIVETYFLVKVLNSMPNSSKKVE